MLNSLAIKNFRNLEDLQIESLGQINLITGKNNTGKTAFLEAVAIYQSKGDISIINELQWNRGENRSARRPEFYFSLFTGHSVGNNFISIGTLNSSLFGAKAFGSNSIVIKFSDLHVVPVNLEIHYQNKVDKHPSFYDENNQYISGTRPKKKKFTLEFVSSPYLKERQNGILWDKIVLTEKESNVVEALKIIENTTERITFVSTYNKRVPIIKVKNFKNTVSLKSMGDGINRILDIILALVNVENGTLLIDEFENGLHYTSQKKLWEVIFFLSHKLKIQVFATTHSYDCIRSFQETINENKTDITTNLIRLDNKNGKIVQVGFDGDELKIATENNIEIR